MTDQTTHQGNDPIGAPTTHRGRIENCPAPECQGIVAEEAETSAPDPRQPAHDAVFAPSTVVARNALIWWAVHTALDAMGVPAAEQPKED